MKLTRSRIAMPFTVLVALSLPVAVTLASLAGCGGGGEQSTITGSPTTPGSTRGTISIRWPVRAETRLIPVASNSVKITITNGAGFSASQVIARPATSAAFENLPPGTLTVNAEAYPDASAGASPAQASGVQTITAVADEPFAINLTMDSTIDRLSLTRSAEAVTAGESATFAVTAQNAAGDLVLTGATTWQWSSSAADVATLAADGANATVSTLTAGTTDIRVTETESGKTATLGLTVSPAPSPSPSASPTPNPVITTPSGLQYQDIVIGTGRAPVLGKRVAVYYVGTFKDGTVFDSRQQAPPFIFTIGVGQVIKGWDEGVAGMKEGGKRKLFVPSELAYGATGSQGGTVPPNTPIDFEVELLEIEP